MFRRLIFEDYTAACLIVAFTTVATIFLGFAWRALRMSRTQVDRFAQLPFAAEGAVDRAATDTRRHNP
jgi:hypothetical protein